MVLVRCGALSMWERACGRWDDIPAAGGFDWDVYHEEL